MKYDKPFLTYEQQINRLWSKYSITQSIDPRIDKTLLESISYYDLVNGYQDCFINNPDIKSLSLIDLFYFKVFDMNFQNILFKYSVFAENSFKTKLAYILSKNYGEHIDNYLNIHNFSSSRRNRSGLNSTLKKIRDVLLKDDEPTKHYRDNHNHIPAWILFKNVNFNNCINLHTFLRKDVKLTLIKRFFEVSSFSNDDYFRLFKGFISIVRKFRNKIAHNAKFITYRVEPEYELIQYKLFQLNPYDLMRGEDFNSQIGRNDIFSMIISLCVILDNPFLARTMLYEIRAALNTPFKDLGVDIIGEYLKITKLPTNLINRIDNINFEKILENHLKKWKEEKD